MAGNWIRSIRDATDILRRARSPVELTKGLVPSRWLSRRVLNAGAAMPKSADPSTVAQALRRLRNQLEAQSIDSNGQVDYGALRRSESFRQLGADAALLRAVDPKALSNDALRNAFWINLYNVLAIHGVLALEIESSVMEVPSFFGTVAYDVGGFVVTLDEIENGILRRNAPHPATGSRLFAPGDPRLSLRPSEVDPRIHAALVCASTSCPPVAFYDAERLEAQLDAASRNYVGADAEVDPTARQVRLPITFRYYADDFGGIDGVRHFVVRYADEAQRPELERAFAEGYALDYHRYDWSLNSPR